MTNLKSITKTCLSVLFVVMLSLTIGFSLLFKSTNANTGTTLTLSAIEDMGLNFTVQKTKIREAITTFESSENEIVYGYNETSDGVGAFNYPSLQNFYNLYTLTEDEYHNEIFTEAKMFSTTASQIPNETYDSGSFLPTDYPYDKLFYKDNNGDYKDVFYDADMVNNEVAPSGSYFIIQNYETKNNLSKGITTSERVDNLYLSFGDYYTNDHPLDTTITALQVSATLYNKTYGESGIRIGTKYNTDISSSSDFGETYFGSIIPQTGLDITGDNRVNYFWYAYLDLENIYCVDNGAFSSLFGNKIADTEGRYELTFTFITYDINDTNVSSTYKFNYSFYLINEDTYVNYPEFNESVTAGSSENMEVKYRNYYYNFLNREYPTYVYDPNKFNISFTHNYNDVINEYSTTFKNTGNFTYNNYSDTNVTYDANLFTVYKNVYTTGNANQTTLTKEFNYSIATFSVYNYSNSGNGEITAYHFYFKSKDNAKAINNITFKTQTQNGQSLKLEGLDAFDFMYSEKVVYLNKTFEYSTEDGDFLYSADANAKSIKVYRSDVDTLDYNNLLSLALIDSYYDSEQETEINCFTEETNLYDKELTLDINFYVRNKNTNTINRTYANYFFQANNTIDKDLLLLKSNNYNEVVFDTLLDDAKITEILGTIKTHSYNFFEEDDFKNLFKSNLDASRVLDLLHYAKNYTIINSNYSFAGNSLNASGSDVQFVKYFNFNEEMEGSDKHIITTNNINFESDYEALNGTTQLLYSVNAINNIIDISNKKDLTINLEFKNLGKFDVVTKYSTSAPNGQDFSVCENETSYNLKINVKNDKANRETAGITLSKENIIAISGLPLEVMESGNGGLKEETVQNPSFENFKYTYTPIFKTILDEDLVNNEDGSYITISESDNNLNIKAKFVCEVANYIVSYRKQQSITYAYTDGTTVTTTYSDDVFDYRTLDYTLYVVQDEADSSLSGRYYAYKKQNETTKFTFVKNFIDCNSTTFYIVDKDYSKLCNEQTPSQVYLGEIYDYSNQQNIPVKITISNNPDNSDLKFNGQQKVEIVNSETNSRLYEGFYDKDNQIITLTKKGSSTDSRYLTMSDSEEFLEIYDGSKVEITLEDGSTKQEVRAIIKNKFETTENGLILNFSTGLLANSFRNVTVLTNSNSSVYSHTTQTGASDTDQTFYFIYENPNPGENKSTADIKVGTTGDSIFYPGSKTMYVNNGTTYSAYNVDNSNKTLSTYTTHVSTDSLILDEGDNALTSIAPSFDGYSLINISSEYEGVLTYIKLDSTNTYITNLLTLKPNSNANGYLYEFQSGTTIAQFNTAFFKTHTDLGVEDPTGYIRSSYNLKEFINGKPEFKDGAGNSLIASRITIGQPNTTSSEYATFGYRSSVYQYDEANKDVYLLLSQVEKLTYTVDPSGVVTETTDASYSKDNPQTLASQPLYYGAFTFEKEISGYKIYKGQDFYNLNGGNPVYLYYQPSNPYNAYLLKDDVENFTEGDTDNLYVNNAVIAGGFYSQTHKNFYLTKKNHTSEAIKTIALSLQANDVDLIRDGKSNDRVTLPVYNGVNASDSNVTFNGVYNGESVKITYNKLTNTNTNLEVKIYSTSTETDILKQTGYYSLKIRIAKDNISYINGYIVGSNNNAYITITESSGDFTDFGGKTFNFDKTSTSTLAIFKYSYLNSSNIENQLLIKVSFDTNSATLVKNNGTELTGNTLSIDSNYFGMYINNKENIGQITEHISYESIGTITGSETGDVFVFTNNSKYENIDVTSSTTQTIDPLSYTAYTPAFTEVTVSDLNSYVGKYITKTNADGSITYVKVDDNNKHTLDIIEGTTKGFEINFSSSPSIYSNKDSYIGKYVKNTTYNYIYVDTNVLQLVDGADGTNHSDILLDKLNLESSTPEAYQPHVFDVNTEFITNNQTSYNLNDYYNNYIYNGSDYYLVTVNNHASLQSNGILVLGSTFIHTLDETPYYKSVGTRANKSDYVGFYFRTDKNAEYVRITKDSEGNISPSGIAPGVTECYIPLQFDGVGTQATLRDYYGYFIQVQNEEYTLITSDNVNNLVTVGTTQAYSVEYNIASASDTEDYLGKYIYVDTDTDGTNDTYIPVSTNAYIHTLDDGTTVAYLFKNLTQIFNQTNTIKTTLTFSSGEFSNKFSKTTIVSEFQDILVQSSGISKEGKTLNVIGSIGLFNKDGYIEFKDELNNVYSDVTNDLNNYYKYESTGTYYTTIKNKADNTFSHPQLTKNYKDSETSTNLYNILDAKNNNENRHWQGITLKQSSSGSNVFNTIAKQIPVTNLPPVKFDYYCTYAYSGLVSESYIYRYKNYKVAEDGTVTVTRASNDWKAYVNDYTPFDYYTELFTKNTILNDDGYYEIVVKFTYDSYDIGEKRSEVFYQVFSFVIDKTDPEFTLEKEVEKVHKDTNTTYLTWANYENNYYTNGNVRISWRIPNYFQASITPYISKVNYDGIVVGTDGSSATPLNSNSKFPNSSFVPYSQTLRIGNSKEGIEQTYIYEYKEIKNISTFTGDRYSYVSDTNSYVLDENGIYEKVVVNLRNSSQDIQTMNLTNYGYYMEIGTRYYLYFFSDNSSSNNLTYWGSGNYQARFTYGASSLSYSTTSFKVDTLSIKGMQIIPIVSTDKGYIYSDVKFTSGSDSYINQPFSFIYNPKESGASISTTYYRIPFKDLNTETIQLLLSNDDLGISANSAVNGISNNSNTEKPYYYNYNIQKYGQVVKNGNEFIPNDSCLYLFKLKDSAGNTAQYFTLYDTTAPNYIIETEEDYNERYNIVTDTASLVWGDYKAVEVISAKTKTVTNGTTTVTNQGYVNNHYVFDNEEDPTATTLSIILRDIVQDQNRTTRRYKGTIVKRFLKTTIGDTTEYNELRYVEMNGTLTYQVFKDGKWINENNLVETNITYFLLVPLQSVEVEYYKTNSDDVKHYTYEYNKNVANIPSAMATKLQGKFENKTTAYPKLNVMQEAMANLGIQSAGTYTLQGPYGFYGEQQYYFTISDILKNESLTTLWMNFDKAQAFGKGNFMVDNAQSIDDLYDSYLDLESAFSVSQLFFSYYPESMDTGIPASEISYKHYNFDIDYKNSIKSITWDNVQQKYVITFTDGSVQDLLTAKLDEAERSEPNSSYPFSIKPSNDWEVIANEEILSDTPSSFKDINDKDRWYSSVINQTSNKNLQNATAQGLYVFKRVYVNYLITDETTGEITGYNKYQEEYDHYKGLLDAWFKTGVTDFDNWLTHIITNNDDISDNNLTYTGQFWLVNDKLKSYDDLVSKIYSVKNSPSGNIFNNNEINNLLESLIWEKISLDKGFVVVDLGYDTITRYYVYYVDRNGIISKVIELNDNVNLENPIGGEIQYTLGSAIDGVNGYKGGYEFEYDINEILSKSSSLDHDYAYTSDSSNQLFDTNKEYVNFKLPIDKYNENKVYYSFMKQFIDTDSSGNLIIKDLNGKTVTPDKNGNYIILDSKGNVIPGTKEEIIVNYGQLNYKKINTFLSGVEDDNCTFLKSVLEVAELNFEKITNDQISAIKEILNSYINRTLFNIYSETVFELKLDLTLNGLGTSTNNTNLEIQKPIHDNEINESNGTNKYVLSTGNIQNSFKAGIDRVDENITNMYLFQPNIVGDTQNPYLIDLTDTSGIWVLNNQYANEYHIDFRINNTTPTGVFYGKNDSAYKTNLNEDNYSQNIFDVEKNDLASMIKQEYLTVNSERNGFTTFKSTNNQTLIFVFEDVETENGIAKINPYEITITKEYVNSSGQLTTETIFKRSKTLYPEADKYIYDQNEKKAEKMRTAFIENLDSEDDSLTTRQWGVVIFDAYAKDENFHNLLSNPNDNAIYKVTLQYYGIENNYTYYDNVTGDNDAINNGTINGEKTVSFYYGNFEIVEDNIKPLYNLIQLMDNDNYIPLLNSTNLDNALANVQYLNSKKYSDVDILVLEILRNRLGITDKALLGENTSNTEILTDIFKVLEKTFDEANYSILTSQDKLYMQYAMNLIYEEYYESYSNASLGYFKDNNKNNILAKDYLQNYFFAVTEDFNFVQVSNLDNTSLFFRKISDPSTYRFSLTMDDFKTTTGDLQANNHQVFVEAEAKDILSLSNKPATFDDETFYRLSFSIDDETSTNSAKLITLNIGALIEAGLFNIGDYIEIIERDEAGNYRVYGIHITTKYNGLQYSYLDVRNYKNTKKIGAENNGMHSTTINGTDFSIVDYIQYRERKVTNAQVTYTPADSQDGFLKAEIMYRFSKNIGTIDNPNYQDHSVLVINDKQVTEYYYNTTPITIYLNPINNKIIINYGDCSLINIYRFENDESYKYQTYFTVEDFETIIKKICDSITGEDYGRIATDFKLTIDFIERAGENLHITYNYPGALLKYRKTVSSKGFTITLPADSINRSTIIVNFYAYRYTNGNWQLLDTDNNNIRINQGDGSYSLGGKDGTSYFFGTGSYKFTLIDNFGRSASYFERFQVGSVEPTLSFKNVQEYKNEKYTAQEVSLQYDATIYVPYVFYYYENGNVNKTYLDILDGINNKQLNGFDYVISLKKSTAFSEGNVNILTITPPSEETKIKFEIHLIDISTGAFENKEYYHGIELGENKNLVNIMSFNFYTILPKLEVSNESGLLLDAKNETFIENVNLTMNIDNCDILFNSRMVITKTLDNKNVTVESSEPFTVKETGKYTVYITNDLKNNSDQITFERREGDAIYYSVRASQEYNTSSYELIASTQTASYTETVTNEDGSTSETTYPMYLYFAQNTYINYIEKTTTVGTITKTSYESDITKNHIEIVTNTNRGIDYELVEFDTKDPYTDPITGNITNCLFVIYKITMGTSATTVQTFRYIKITFIDPVDARNSNIAEMEILNGKDNILANCDSGNIIYNYNVKTVTEHITVKFSEYYHIDTANEIYFKHYVNNNPTPEIIRIGDLPTVTIEGEPSYYYYKTNITGLHTFYVYDLAHITTMFNQITEDDSSVYKDHFNLFLINGVRYSLNGDEDSINNQIYNSEVLLSIVYSIRTEDTTITLYNDDVEITATRNGNLYEIAEVSTNTFSFADSGYYEVTLSGIVVLGGDETSQQIVTTKFAFRILNPNSALPSLDISKSKEFELLEMKKKTENTENSYFVDINIDYYNQELAKNYSNLTLWLNALHDRTYENEEIYDFDKKYGNGYYYIRMRAYVPSISDYKEFEFYVWINAEYPTITSSHAYGTTTKAKIKLSYNPNSIYSMIGNSKIVITRGKTVVDTIVIDENSTNSIESYTITTRGEYWIQIYTEDDKLITSYKITKKDPLNSSAVFIIIIACVGAVGLTILFIILRRRAKFK